MNAPHREEPELVPASISLTGDASAGDAFLIDLEPVPSAPPVDLRQVFAIWLPLVISFELMTMEGPSLQAAVGRLPSPQLNLAGWGLTMALSLLIESPVIMLLATSIALVADAAAYRTLRRFTLMLCGGCTLLTALVAYTPLYEFVTYTVMRQPFEIRMAARPGLEIMLLWSAAIGYRRFYQGILIRNHHARKVTWGTSVRLITMLSTAISLVAARRLSGVEVAACAIMAAVLSEAVATWLFARRVVRESLLDAREPVAPTQPPLTMGAVIRFHGPLALTTLLALLVEPINAAALAWLPHPEITLAAWPVAFMATFVIRGCSFPLQESAVSMAARPGGRASLWRAAWMVGAGTSALLAVIVYSPLLELLMNVVLQVPPLLHPFVRTAVNICLLQPLATALGMCSRGILMAVGATGEVYGGMGVSLIAQIALLAAMIAAHLPGMEMAAVASLGSTTVECLYLYWRTRRH